MVQSLNTQEPCFAHKVRTCRSSSYFVFMTRLFSSHPGLSVCLPCISWYSAKQCLARSPNHDMWSLYPHASSQSDSLPQGSSSPEVEGLCIWCFWWVCLEPIKTNQHVPAIEDSEIRVRSFIPLLWKVVRDADRLISFWWQENLPPGWTVLVFWICICQKADRSLQDRHLSCSSK